jgi:hypothetical protein
MGSENGGELAKIMKDKIKSLNLEADNCIEIMGAYLVKFLKRKNREYGSSYLAPVNIFSKVDGLESLKARIDEKLKRMLLGDIKPEHLFELSRDLSGQFLWVMILLEKSGLGLMMNEEAE